MIKKIYSKIEELWKDKTEPALLRFVELPALSPDFDPSWDKNGELRRAVEEAKAWAESLPIAGLKCEIIQESGYPPCLYVDIEHSPESKEKKAVFLYGHLDKQPPGTGWDEDKAPYKGVISDGKMYGRGSADDGYSFYTALSSILALQQLGLSHPRCVGLFETCEESNSVHYEEYLDAIESRIGEIGLVIALDSCCGDYERLWITQSLRGMIGGKLTVEVLHSGVHSGEASGIVPSSFMILRELLGRVENCKTGVIEDKAFATEIPADAIEHNKRVATLLKDRIWEQFPFIGNTQPRTKDSLQLLLNRNWRPELTVTGIDGIPSVGSAGNVMRPYTAIKIGMRLPPNADAKAAAETFKKIVVRDPPFEASVTYDSIVECDGWVAPTPSKWLSQAFDYCSEHLWGNKTEYLGMGGSIPLLNVFTTKWPDAQYMVAGVLGPQANAHGPNEFLNIKYSLNLSTVVSYVINQYRDATL